MVSIHVLCSAKVAVSLLSALCVWAHVLQGLPWGQRATAGRQTWPTGQM